MSYTAWAAYTTTFCKHHHTFAADDGHHSRRLPICRLPPAFWWPCSTNYRLPVCSPFQFMAGHTNSIHRYGVAARLVPAPACWAAAHGACSPCAQVPMPIPLLYPRTSGLVCARYTVHAATCHSARRPMPMLWRTYYTTAHLPNLTTYRARAAAPAIPPPTYRVAPSPPPYPLPAAYPATAFYLPPRLLHGTFGAYPYMILCHCPLLFIMVCIQDGPALPPYLLPSRLVIPLILMSEHGADALDTVADFAPSTYARSLLDVLQEDSRTTISSTIPFRARVAFTAAPRTPAYCSHWCPAIRATAVTRTTVQQIPDRGRYLAGGLVGTSAAAGTKTTRGHAGGADRAVPAFPPPHISCSTARPLRHIIPTFHHLYQVVRCFSFYHHYRHSLM